MSSCAIDAKDQLNVAVTDIPKAFLPADMRNNTYINRMSNNKVILDFYPRIYRKYCCKSKDENQWCMWIEKRHYTEP